MCGDTILLVTSLALGGVRTQGFDTIIEEIGNKLTPLNTLDFLLCERLGLGFSIRCDTLSSLAISDGHLIFARGALSIYLNGMDLV